MYIDNKDGMGFNFRTLPEPILEVYFFFPTIYIPNDSKVRSELKTELKCAEILMKKI